MAISINDKEEARILLQELVDRFESVPKASASLNRVSASTIRTILKGGDYPNISDEMWRNIRSQLRGDKPGDLVLVETPVIKDLTFFFQETQEDMDFSWAVSSQGSGKTEAALKYAKEHKNVFYVLCDEDMSKADFAQELAKAVGLRINTQKKARTIILEVIQELSEMESPLIIFDEGDKLRDNILYYFITIYNRLKDYSGVAFLSTDYMKKRMENGLKRNIKGFKELWSRIGSKFYEVDKNEAYHVNLICRANGVTDQKSIDIVIKDAEKADLDLRRAVKKMNKIRKGQKAA
ncbi:uncharacterized protein BN783_01614 [Odoribacter sp. CAG:788]|jgi:DNA transposition AAA+ family ATPase|nr:uncharacterized protein BN783_01614 [Odoribacter sp. CAG:788]